MKSKFFHAYLKNYIFLKNTKLQKGYIEYLKEHEIVKKSNIYFVSKIKKIRFCIKNLKIGFNGNLCGALYYGNEKIKFNYPLIDFYYSIPEINNHFNSPLEFLNTYYTCSIPIDFIQQLCIKYKFYKNSAINTKLSNNDGKNIIVNSSLMYKLTNYTDQITIESENFFGLLEQDGLLPKTIECYPELIYIGISKDITSRTSKHDKFSKFYEELNDDEELLFYFLEFDEAELSIDNLYNNFKVISNDYVNNINDTNKIQLLETSLINYFKPKLNTQKKDSDLTTSKKVDECLKKNGFTDINIEIDVAEEILSTFGNYRTSHSNKHFIEFTL
jgi:hypothetical protein